MVGFRNLLRFREVIPHLVRLLNAGGIWMVDCEDAYSALVKCRVEQVCHYSKYCPSILTSLGFIGYGTCD